MSIVRSQLIGKKLYNPDGSYVGEIIDIGLQVGTNKFVVIAKVATGATLEVEWEKVGAIKDIVILKEKVEVPSLPVTTPTTVIEAQVPEEKKETKTSIFSLPFGKKKPEEQKFVQLTEASKIEKKL